MPRKAVPTTYIIDAILLLQKAQQGIRFDLAGGEKTAASQGKDLARLEKTLSELRTTAIKCDLAAGLRGKEAAAKYGLSEARISQIRNSHSLGGTEGEDVQ